MSSPVDYLAHVRSDVDRVATLAAAPGALAAAVPACPGWPMRKLVTHLARVHRMVTVAITEGRAPTRGPDDPTPEQPDALLAWFRAGADRMLAVLPGPVEQPAWAFDPHDQTLGFWQRRQAMENVVHRVDAEQAVGAQTPIDPDLAADGVSEVLDVMIRLRHGEGAVDLPPGTVTLRARDVDQTWTLGAGGEAAVVVGTAEQLLLTLWQRARPESITDDPTALAILRAPLTP